MIRSALPSFVLALLVSACASPPPKPPPPPPPEPPAWSAPPSRRVGREALPSKTDRSVLGRRAWYHHLRWPVSCEQAFERTSPPDKPEAGGIQFHAVAPRRWVVRVGCASGLSQSSETYVLFDENGDPPSTAPLVFPTFSVVDGKVVREDAAVLWGEDRWDESRREVTLVTRASEGCGTRARYRLEGNRIVLVELRAKRNCDGRPSDPASWTQLIP